MKLQVGELFECESYHGCASLFRVRIYAPGEDAGAFLGEAHSLTTLLILSKIP